MWRRLARPGSKLRSPAEEVFLVSRINISVNGGHDIVEGGGELVIERCTLFGHLRSGTMPWDKTATEELGQGCPGVDMLGRSHQLARTATAGMRPLRLLHRSWWNRRKVVVLVHD